eukprot:CAMPEP_0185803278 /NCGR_PEP_ID=MMETSP1322-20130828/2531_1 /TAXON_ID=265543 /ORGANISM="Minutocellus polymorphus, Strain RCC2270" /LENGTH=210 /DNA_ID=CAMNT_0028499141 /DNA_START=111 /DNA_END=743 /DNA_ORIENTATION=-
MASSIGEIHALLADEFLSGHFTVGIVNFPEIVEGILVASLGRNLPVADSDFMISRLIFAVADVVTRRDISSQRAYSIKQSGPFLIDGHSVALVEAIPNATTTLRRTEFNGPNKVIEGFEVVFGYSTFTPPINFAYLCKCGVIILQTPCLKMRILLIEAGRVRFTAERTNKGKLLAGILLLVLLVYGCFVFHVARPANLIATTRLITGFEF